MNSRNYCDMQSGAKPFSLPILLGLALLAVVPYLPTLDQPLIADDYPIIRLARLYGPVSGWRLMLGDDVQRPRATAFVVSYWVQHTFGMKPAAFYGLGILLHILNCWLLYVLGQWEAVTLRVSLWSAAFFAIYEGHQEAVMWYSACNELLFFLFGMLSMLCWVAFLRRQRWYAYIASICFFVLALLSKETAVVFVGILFLPLLFPVRRIHLSLFLLPFVLLSIGYSLLVFQTRGHSFHFHDRSFELSAPFWITWTKSFAALLWFWGLLASIALIVQRRSRLLLLPVTWISISFVPYMFIAYMHRIPSRHVYLASAGLAMIVGAALATFRERMRIKHPYLLGMLLALMLVHNIGYLWTKKRQQYLERAEPTEQLIAFAKKVNGPIYVRAFPLPPIVGDAAVELMLGKPVGSLIWNEEEARKRGAANEFCYERK